MQMLPKEQLAEFSVDQVRALLNGRADVDLASMRKTTRYQGDLHRKSQVCVVSARCLGRLFHDVRLRARRDTMLLQSCQCGLWTDFMSIRVCVHGACSAGCALVMAVLGQHDSRRTWAISALHHRHQQCAIGWV